MYAFNFKISAVKFNTMLSFFNLMGPIFLPKKRAETLGAHIYPGQGNVWRHQWTVHPQRVKYYRPLSYDPFFLIKLILFYFLHCTPLIIWSAERNLTVLKITLWVMIISIGSKIAFSLGISSWGWCSNITYRYAFFWFTNNDNTLFIS